MPFDLSTAKPVAAPSATPDGGGGGFDLSTAKPTQFGAEISPELRSAYAKKHGITDYAAGIVLSSARVPSDAASVDDLPDPGALLQERRKAVAGRAMEQAQERIATGADLEKPGAWARVGRGAEDITRGAEALGLRAVQKGALDYVPGSIVPGAALLPESVKQGAGKAADELVRRNMEEESTYQRGRGPDAGHDWYRTFGQIGAAAPLMLVPGVGEGVGGAAITGGAQGALLGAAEAAGKGEDIGKGALFGGAGGAAGGAVLRGLVVPAIRGIISKFGPEADATATLDAIKETLSANGIDWEKMSAGMKNDIQAEVTAALKGGASVDAETAANKAILQQAGVEAPTLGQITQDPSQYGKELFLRETAEGGKLAQQYQAALRGLNESVQSLRTPLPEAMATPEAGERIMQPLGEAAQRGQQLVGRAYKQFEAGAPEDFTIDGAATANRFFEEAERQPGLRNLPESLKTTLNNLATGKQPKMTLVDAEAVNQEISRQLSGAKPAERYALLALKSHLDKAVDEAASGTAAEGSSSGTDLALREMRGQSSDLGDRLFAARQYAAQRFQLLDQIPAMKAVAQERIAPDDFLRRYVTGSGAKVEDVRNLMDFLHSSDPEAAAQVKAQVLSELHQVANKGSDGKFLQDAFNKRISALENSGKLDAIFSPEEINQLHTIGYAARLLEGPQGVSRTGMGGSAKLQGWLNRALEHMVMAKHPVIGAALRYGKNVAAGMRAANPSLGTPPAPPQLPATVQSIAPVAGAEAALAEQGGS